MPNHLSDEQYAHALLESIQNGSYPDSEDVIAAVLPSTAIPSILRLLKQAQEDVKVDLRRNSKQSAQDIDGWIVQAKQLRNDIHVSQQASQQIAKRAADNDHLRGKVRDASGKAGLLREEVAFTDTLVRVYERVGGIRRSLDIVQEHLVRDECFQAIGWLSTAENELRALSSDSNSQINGVFRKKLSRLQEEVKVRVLELWKSMIYFDPSSSRFHFGHQLQRSSLIELDTLVDALHQLDLLKDVIRTFCKDFELTVLKACISPSPSGHFCLVIANEETIQISGIAKDRTLENLFVQVRHIIEFLHRNLPASIAAKISDTLLPMLISGIEETWLSPSIPTDVLGLQDFQAITVRSVLDFADILENYHWPGCEELRNWTSSIPRQWLSKRQESALGGMKAALATGIGVIETVERAETQFLSKQEDVLLSPDTDDGWNAEWSDEEQSISLSGKLHRPKTPEVPKTPGAEDDTSAWGWDKEMNGSNQRRSTERVIDEAVDEDAWGWGDNDGQQSEETASSKPRDDFGETSRQTRPKLTELLQGAKKEVTLKETYNITALPKEVLEIVMQVHSDMGMITSSSRENWPIASVGAGLSTLPGLVLAMYRAGAPLCYSFHASGNMFLYNDSLWLAERLQEYQKGQKNSRMKLDPDISALSAFGKRAYGREMESQRTILSDLLDGAQGFSNCTVAPFAHECDLAISSVVDRLRDIYRQWQAVLSHSALLQSIGSLLSTAINKIIVDIEDMSNISEPESQRLAAFCNRMGDLEALFMPPQQSTEGAKAVVPLTAVYTPGWLKFQYLANILESSLVDIKYLWEEGELRLEFDVDEVVELIEALFADSEHRRRAVGDIRRA